jgi:4-diphosphocytidyl-2-C-methyl-D-erythritol kinase
VSVPRAHGDVAPVRVFSPAKLNLNLRALDLRADGYRELDTEMLLLDFGDELELAPCARPGVHLTLAGPALTADIPADERNLAAQAVRRVLDAVGGELGLSVHLEKRVPSGAGLGGGSSNAAAALRGALQVLGLESDPAFGGEWRARVLAELGSDTVFFEVARATGRARCTGRGERVEPLAPLAEGERFQLATPDFHGATARVYGRLSERRASGAGADAPIGSAANDLAAAAFDLEPRLGRLQTDLGEAWQLTGSGSTFFKRAPGNASERELHPWRLWTTAGPWRAGGPK